MPLPQDETTLINRLKAISTATLYDAGRRLDLDVSVTGLVSITQAKRMAGRATTIRLAPRNAVAAPLNLYQIVGDAKPGSVVVVELGQDLWVGGGNMVAFATRCGMAGMLIDGGVRDLEEVGHATLPVFCRGPAVRGYGTGYALEAVDISVQCCGVRAEPGDYVVGDADGAVMIPAAQVEELLYQADEIVDLDAAQSAGIRDGWTVAELRANTARWHHKRA